MSIEFWTWNTPNGRKISVALEEMGLAYTVKPVNISKNEQFNPDFLKFSPNNRIPAIVDPDGPGGTPITVFESGAILVYLGAKTGQFWPSDLRAQVPVLEWLMWQMGGFGPMLGQAHHFRRAAPEPIQYAIDRYTNEAKRLYGVIDGRLGEAEYLGGDEYTIADIITYPWAARHEWHAVDLNEFPNVKRWYDQVGARPAVQRGMAVPKV